MREWIVNAENGLICDEGDSTSLASCIVKVLRHPKLRIEAAEINRYLVRTRAEYAAGMAEAEKLYSEVANSYARRKLEPRSFIMESASTIPVFAENRPSG